CFSTLVSFLPLRLSRHRPLRDLHSFPTRRSSDLVGLTSRSSGGNECRRSRPWASRRLGPTSWSRSSHPAIDPARRSPRSRIGERDRKSTRLNSSHQIISYAVFCLKKKKKLINSRH